MTFVRLIVLTKQTNKTANCLIAIARRRDAGFSGMASRGGWPGRGYAGLAPMASIFYNIPARNIFDRKKYRGIGLP
jgi:hypothetical protein